MEHQNLSNRAFPWKSLFVSGITCMFIPVQAIERPLPTPNSATIEAIHSTVQTYEGIVLEASTQEPIIGATVQINGGKMGQSQT